MSLCRPLLHPNGYVVRAKAKQEARAEINLRSWGLKTFVPRVREYRQGTGRAGETVALLFPSYMFARFTAAELLGKVRMTRGVQAASDRRVRDAGRIVGDRADQEPVD